MIPTCVEEKWGCDQITAETTTNEGAGKKFRAWFCDVCSLHSSKRHICSWQCPISWKISIWSPYSRGSISDWKGSDSSFQISCFTYILGWSVVTPCIGFSPLLCRPTSTSNLPNFSNEIDPLDTRNFPTRNICTLHRQWDSFCRILKEIV